MMNKLLTILSLSIVALAFKPAPADPEVPADVQVLLDKHGCNVCHKINRKMVGPSWLDIAAKGYSAKKITALVKKPEPGNWPGYAPMLAQTNVPKAELSKISTWLSNLK
jgi:cytochrome c551/c552